MAAAIRTLCRKGRCRRLLPTARSISRTNVDLGRAARDLGVSRVTLYRLLESHGFDIASFLKGLRTDGSLTAVRQVTLAGGRGSTDQGLY